MNKLKIFENEEFDSIRTIEENGKGQQYFINRFLRGKEVVGQSALRIG